MNNFDEQCQKYRGQRVKNEADEFAYQFPALEIAFACLQAAKVTDDQTLLERAKSFDIDQAALDHIHSAIEQNRPIRIKPADPTQETDQVWTTIF